MNKSFLNDESSAVFKPMGKGRRRQKCRVILVFLLLFHFRKLPVLIQGETSVGKTSLIQWLAKASGNHCVRINNHEHTDIQEYLGCYTSDENGKLVFKEGK